jgi:hypothetical protein
VFEVMRDLNGYKGPGPDKFTMAFFQKCCEVLKRTSWKFSRSFIAEGSLRRALMQLVSFIPKKAGVVTLRTSVIQFSGWCLYNCF